MPKLRYARFEEATVRHHSGMDAGWLRESNLTSQGFSRSGEDARSGPRKGSAQPQPKSQYSARISEGTEWLELALCSYCRDILGWRHTPRGSLLSRSLAGTTDRCTLIACGIGPTR